MFGRRRPVTPSDPQVAGKRNPLLRVLTADVVLRGASFALRQAVERGLVKGAAADKVPTQAPSPATRVATAVAARSVPGALLVGSGLVLAALYRRGLARRAARGGEQVPPPT